MAKRKIYTVHFYTNGFCYLTVTHCPWEAVKEYKALAKQLGETVKVEFDYYENY